MFSRWLVTNISSAHGTLHCRKTRVPCGDQLVVCGQYTPLKRRSTATELHGQNALIFITLRREILKSHSSILPGNEISGHRKLLR
jgi:hypothetical protein